MYGRVPWFIASARRTKKRNGLPDKSRAGLERLIESAQRDTGHSRIVTNFLLAWWNAQECGGFDLTEVWGVDTEIALDMLRVFALVAERHQYPDNMGYGRQFEAIVRAWRTSPVERALTTAAEEDR